MMASLRRPDETVSDSIVRDGWRRFLSGGVIVYQSVATSLVSLLPSPVLLVVSLVLGLLSCCLTAPFEGVWSVRFHLMHELRMVRYFLRGSDTLVVSVLVYRAVEPYSLNLRNPTESQGAQVHSDDHEQG